MGDIILSPGNNELNVQLVPIVQLANLFGVVTDAQAGLPISGVRVSINGYTIFTDANGSYSFTDLTPGAYTIEFSKEGYETKTL